MVLSCLGSGPIITTNCAWGFNLELDLPDRKLLFSAYTGNKKGVVVPDFWHYLHPHETLTWRDYLLITRKCITQIIAMSQLLDSNIKLNGKRAY